MTLKTLVYDPLVYDPLSVTLKNIFVQVLHNCSSI